jgi:hypothetical protein
MFLFDIRLVNNRGLVVAEQDRNGDMKVVEPPYIKCGCGKQINLELGSTYVYINEFQLATLLRILKSRNKELYSRLNKFYDDVSHNISYVEEEVGNVK